MPTLTLAYPNAELVCQAWLAAHTGIPAGLIAGSLPKATDQEPRTWERFLTARALPAGSPSVELTEKRGSVLQVDLWAAKLRQARPLWGVALTMAESIRYATFRDAQTFGRPLEMPVSGYLPARVLSVYLVTEPTRVEGDPSAYAHVTLDLAVDWTV